jgi:hypothetical protein
MPTDQAAALAQLYDRITPVDLNTLSVDVDELNTMDASLATLDKAQTAAEVVAEQHRASKKTELPLPRRVP